MFARIILNTHKRRIPAERKRTKGFVVETTRLASQLELISLISVNANVDAHSTLDATYNYAAYHTILKSDFLRITFA